MKRYLFECNGCARECRLLLKDAHAVARFCSVNKGVSNWQRSGEFEEWEDVTGESEALKIHNENLRAKCNALGEINKGLENENDSLRRRLDSVVEWIDTLLALGTSGLRNITGKGADNE